MPGADDRPHEPVQVHLAVHSGDANDRVRTDRTVLLTLGGGWQGFYLPDGCVVGVGLFPPDPPNQVRKTFKLPVELPGRED